uniref:Uncharacterized protein n=1 Tax=Lepeophtheirus salmonis TaxID=72036 RepID=A0A0K2UBE5_LEPSM
MGKLYFLQAQCAHFFS